jgi:flagellar biosynthetic protein FliQ
MTPEFVVGFARQAIEMALMISLPMMGVGLVVGVFVSVLQAATQIAYTRDLILNLPNYVG